MPKDDLIVLTGGAGFIGSCFLWKLNHEGHKNILIVDERRFMSDCINLKGKKFVDYIEKEDFLANLKKGKIPKGISAIFHIGACSDTTQSDEAYMMKNNYEYSKILAEWALKNDVICQYASSAATYGDGSKGFSDSDSEMPKLKPLNLYGLSKQRFDMWLLENKLTSKVVGYKSSQPVRHRIQSLPY